MNYGYRRYIFIHLTAFVHGAISTPQPALILELLQAQDLKEMWCSFSWNLRIIMYKTGQRCIWHTFSLFVYVRIEPIYIFGHYNPLASLTT